MRPGRVSACIDHVVFFWVRVRGNVIQILFYGKLGVMRVVTSQWGLTRPSSICVSLGIVRDVVPLLYIYSAVKSTASKSIEPLTRIVLKWKKLKVLNNFLKWDQFGCCSFFSIEAIYFCQRWCLFSRLKVFLDIFITRRYKDWFFSIFCHEEFR